MLPSRRSAKMPLLYLPMILIGLTGGLASGKTTVAKVFQQCGADIIDADQIARTVVQPGRAAWKDLVAVFGKKILHSDKILNREALAAQVFGHPRRLKILNQIVHPRVAREQARITKAITKKNPNAVIIYDAALLIEANAHKRMDHVILVTTNRDTQIKRTCKRDGLSKQKALVRIQGQLPLRKKKQFADTLIDGTLSRSRLRRQIVKLYKELSEQA